MHAWIVCTSININIYQDGWHQNHNIYAMCIYNPGFMKQLSPLSHSTFLNRYGRYGSELSTLKRDDWSQTRIHIFSYFLSEKPRPSNQTDVLSQKKQSNLNLMPSWKTGTVAPWTSLLNSVLRDLRCPNRTNWAIAPKPNPILLGSFTISFNNFVSANSSGLDSSSSRCLSSSSASARRTCFWSILQMVPFTSHEHSENPGPEKWAIHRQLEMHNAIPWNHAWSREIPFRWWKRIINNSNNSTGINDPWVSRIVQSLSINKTTRNFKFKAWIRSGIHCKD